MLGKGVGGLFFLGPFRSPAQSQAAQEASNGAHAGVLGEGGIVGEIERLDHLDREIARGDHLHLTLHRLLVEHALLRIATVVVGGPREGGLVVLNEDARFGGVERPHHRQHDEGHDPCADGEAEDPALGAPKRAAKRLDVDILCDREDSGQTWSSHRTPRAAFSLDRQLVTKCLSGGPLRNGCSAFVNHGAA